MSEAICLDQKKPSRISDPHGPWWLTVRVPLGPRHHLYIGASTAPRFVPGNHRGGRVLIDTSRLAVLVMPRKFYGGRHIRGWVLLHRFCAHVHCTVGSVQGSGKENGRG